MKNDTKAVIGYDSRLALAGGHDSAEGPDAAEDRDRHDPFAEELDEEVSMLSITERLATEQLLLRSLSIATLHMQRYTLYLMPGCSPCSAVLA